MACHDGSPPGEEFMNFYQQHFIVNSILGTRAPDQTYH
jgi:hypothetical protein